MLNYETRSVDIDIKIVGIGSGGNNALNSMMKMGINDAAFLAVNTDVQALNKTRARTRVAIGGKITGGRGAGGNPDVGLKAVEEDTDKIFEHLDGADVVFLTAGLGGGTGTGAIYKIAEMAQSRGALTIAVVTRPFQFEGRRRALVADKGLELLQKYADTVIVVPNQRLMEITASNISMLEAFSLADNVLYQAVKSMVDLIFLPGNINVDFADINTIMRRSGLATIGIGQCYENDKAEVAAHQAVNSPLIETPITGARRVLINIAGDENLSLYDAHKAAEYVRNQVHEDAEIIFGHIIDPDMAGGMRVTVVATDFARNTVQKGITGHNDRGATIQSQSFHSNSKVNAASEFMSREVPQRRAVAVGETNIDSGFQDLDIPAFLRK
ncbi:MAG: cell division protein FtsZ [Candidatus Wallbacteria bacterium HGW-Wallbacteria-1]|jgi:cell division protein FtsZ|uniref:Cell division protein FtsZ n=1 Tax=Candidatus Wallbacteria bacterium HGW-Wallbacteria-1 TaxID=2013854 RepID=A0A2N1PSD5_9BACT|nr:MAG: cell division protein FtsZ [Candidatus Wallbacteria bacterium HGW-Wallbacteria-1]